MLKTIAAIVAGASLLTCLSTPFAYFYGGIAEPTFQWLFALASLTWFASATVYASKG